MFKHILVPLDRSLRAESAIPVAARLARQSGGTIILTQVINNTVDFWPPVPAEPQLAQEMIDKDIGKAAQYLQEVSASTELEGISTETVAHFGPIAHGILSVALTYHADLIVLCSHGYSGITRWVLGSVAEKIAHSSPIPVLILREGCNLVASPHADDTQPLHVLVPLDGSAYAKTALEPAAQLISMLAAPAAGAIHLVRVVRPEDSILDKQKHGQETNDALIHKAKQYLHTTADHLREGLVAPAVAELGLSITWSVAIDTDVAAALITVAENGEDAEGRGVFGGCDVIAMATHGRTGLQWLTMGSVSERVLRATSLPMLIVRPCEMTKTSKQSMHEATVV